MGLWNKLKNTFFEEEYVEIDDSERLKNERAKPKRSEDTNLGMKEESSSPEKSIEQKKKSANLESIVRQVAHDSEEEKVRIPTKTDENKELNPKGFEIFNDEDFYDYQESYSDVLPKEEVKKEKRPLTKDERLDLYAGNNPTSKPTSQIYGRKKVGFQPTPIISPIYGILDQNYRKEEIPDQKQVKPKSSYVSRKGADLDSVRAKAYGVKPKEEKKEEVEMIEEIDPKTQEEDDSNILFDMTDTSKTPVVDKVTLQDAEEYFKDLGLEYNIDYKDAGLEKATGRSVGHSPEIYDIEEDDELPKKTRTNTKETTNKEDNLLDLIDLMYEERE